MTTNPEDLHVEPQRVWIPVAYIGAILVAAGWIAWHTSRANSALERVEAVAEEHAQHLPKLERSIDRLSMSVDSLMGELNGAASREKLRAWVRILKVQNPTLQIPDFDF
jgi:uncharacterized membrane protein